MSCKTIDLNRKCGLSCMIHGNEMSLLLYLPKMTHYHALYICTLTITFSRALKNIINFTGSWIQVNQIFNNLLCVFHVQKGNNLTPLFKKFPSNTIILPAMSFPNFTFFPCGVSYQNFEISYFIFVYKTTRN